MSFAHASCVVLRDPGRSDNVPKRARYSGVSRIVDGRSLTVDPTSRGHMRVSLLLARRLATLLSVGVDASLTDDRPLVSTPSLLLPTLSRCGKGEGTAGLA